MVHKRIHLDHEFKKKEVLNKRKLKNGLTAYLVRTHTDEYGDLTLITGIVVCDKDGYLHNPKGPAVRWHRDGDDTVRAVHYLIHGKEPATGLVSMFCDGDKLYHWRGKHVSEDEYNSKVFNRDFNKIVGK